MTAINDPEDLAHLRCMFSFPVRKALGQIEATEGFKAYRDRYNCGQKKSLGAKGPKPLDPAPVRYEPPSNSFFSFRRVGSDLVYGRTDCQRPYNNVIEVGTFNGYELRACRVEYHEFELAVLGASLNTKGGTVVAKDKKGNPVLMRVPPKTLLSPQILSIPPPVQ
jgi:hypothetical protein